VSRAHDFLDRFRRAIAADDPLSLITEDSHGFGAAMAELPDELQQELESAVSDEHGPLVVLRDDCFRSAACDRRGGVMIAGTGFESWFNDDDLFGATIAELKPDRPNVSILVNDRTGRPVAVAAGFAAIAKNWPLDPIVRSALESGKADYAIIAYRPGQTSWLRAALASGLTPAESDLVGALARTGDLQRAAKERGIAYETARKFVGSAMRKTGTSKQSELVRQTLSMAGGDMPGAANLERMIRDLFGLTERQARLAILVANGASRDGAATTLGISSNSAKVALKTAYLACGVATGVDMARIVSEISALGALATACDVTITPAGVDTEPLRLVLRSWAEGRIAISDYGPPEGRPVLLFHSSLSGRHHPKTFLSALRDAGYRPISFERAGFGLSDATEGDAAESVVKDIADILAALSITDPLGVSFGTFSAVALTSAYKAGLIRGGALLSPDPPDSIDPTLLNAFMAYGKSLLWQYPKLGDAFVQIAMRRTNDEKISNMFRASVKGIAADEAVFAVPESMRDFVRGAKQASLGSRGVMNEMRALGNGPNPPPIDDASRLTVLFGSEDRFFDVSHAVAFWGGRLPGARVEVIKGAGHFLQMSNTSDFLAALKRL
jgi:pimeloyl-ACP methyl ester carboxylesterase/DNA-binding CsgD family transcriptional regulator